MSLRIALLIVGSALCGFFIASLLPDSAPSEFEENPLADEFTRLGARVDELTAELQSARGEEEFLRAELLRARERRTEEGAAPSAEGETSPGDPSLLPARFVPASGTGRLIRSLAEAEAAFDRAVAARDLEALWLIGADVLAYGEAGYPEFEKLLSRFLEEVAGSDERLPLWDDEEMWLGRVFRVIAEEHEAFLGYALTLAERDPEVLSPALARFRHEVLEDEMLPSLLAFHDGQNPELTGRWLDHLESSLDLPDLGGIDEEAMIYALAQIPGDRPAELLARWLGTRPGNHDDAIRALAFQGSPRALALLRELLPAIEDEILRTAVERRLGM